MTDQPSSPAQNAPPDRNAENSFIFDRVTNWEDRILPPQPVLSVHFRHPPEEFYPRLLDRISQVSTPADPEARFHLEVLPGISFSQFGSNMFVLKTLEMLIKIGRYKRILEIGTFVGVSAMCFADAAGPDGRVVTVEKYPQFSSLAETNIERNGFAGRIDVLQGEALSMLDEIRNMGPFDMIFLDGDKENYCEYYNKLKEMLDPNGLFVVDDVLFHADTLNAVPSTKKGAGVAALLDQLAQDDSTDKVFLPAVNGMVLVRRKDGAVA